MNVLDLFSGIGGFSLGLERAGMRTVAFCEIDPFCRRVLAKHWPFVPCYDDIRTLTADRLKADGIAADVICGGFPCQDISRAGSRHGIGGSRSGLWSEYRRIVSELRPRFVIVENSAELLSFGLGAVLGGLSALGYDARWDGIPASAVGAPHPRDRIWILAHLDPVRCERSNSGSSNIEPEHRRASFGEPPSRYWRDAFPIIRRVVHGVPTRLDRSRVAALGNAVVPQIPEIIGRAIMRANA